MDRNTIENKIKQYKAEMIRDEKMMDKEPRNMFWCEDYNLNSSLLESYEKKLKETIGGNK